MMVGVGVPLAMEVGIMIGLGVIPEQEANSNAHMICRGKKNRFM
jgi:hypothetical protein